MASPAVRSVKIVTLHTIASEANHNVRSVSFSPLIYVTRPWKLILCNSAWQTTRGNNPRDGGHCDGTRHRKMAWLAADDGDNPWRFRNHLSGQNCSTFCETYWKWKEGCVSYDAVVLKLNLILILRDWSVHSGSLFSIQLGPLRRVLAAHCAVSGA